MPRLTSAPLTQKIINATRPPKSGFTPLRDPQYAGAPASDLGVGREDLVARISLPDHRQATSDMGSTFLRAVSLKRGRERRNCARPSPAAVIRFSTPSRTSSPARRPTALS